MEFPIEMYRIREEEMKIKVPCERCLEKGIIDRTCSKCGGKGTHSKTIKVWKVAPKAVAVENIDRSSDDNFYKSTQVSYKNGLRYWTGNYEFYNEGNLLLHFTKSEAQKECDKRNEDIKGLLEIDRKNQNKIRDKIYDVGDKFLFPELSKVVTTFGNQISKQTGQNIVGTISDSRIDEYDGSEYFTLILDGGFGMIILGEQSLSKYNKFPRRV